MSHNPSREVKIRTCPECNHSSPSDSDAIFCPYHGVNLIDKTITLAPGYDNPIGYWRVTTEGDCEGRSTTVLGIFYGHIADIARAFTNRVMYKLEFTSIDPHSGLPEPDPQKTSAEISFPHGTKYSTDHFCGMIANGPPAATEFRVQADGRRGIKLVWRA